MRSLTGGQLLRVWERGLDHKAASRPLAILAEIEGAERVARLSALPIGRRDRLLLALREATLGPCFEAVASCPACEERLDLAFTAADIGGPGGGEAAEPATLLSGDYSLELRLPDSGDLLAVAACPDVESARRALARRCVRTAARGGMPLDAEAVPDDLIREIAGRLEAADPDADMRLEVDCPHCQARSEWPFDIADFLWREIEAEALRLLRDVHRLARGYGWREAEILDMTPLRRRAYLELLGA